MGKVTSGALNKRITIQRKILEQNEWGQPLENWVDVMTVWANIRTVSGVGSINAEQQAGGTEISVAAISIRIRKRKGIDEGMRVLHKTEIFDIRNVLPDYENDEYLDLAVSAGANQGG